MSEEEVKRIFSKRLLGIMSDRNVTRKMIADICNVSKSTVSTWCNGQYIPRMDKIEKIADFFEVTKSYFLEPNGDQGNPKSEDYFGGLKRIPVLGRIAAGSPIYAEENIEGYTYTDLNGGNEYFALKVKGDSMDAAGILDGYTVIVRRQDVVENGQIAVCLIDNQDATLKRFSQHGNMVTLMPQSTNPENKPFVFDLRKNSIKVLGLVVEAKFAVT